LSCDRCLARLGLGARPVALIAAAHAWSCGFGTDRNGYEAMLRHGRQRPERVWAIEGCNGIGRHLAQRLLADGEQVVDVPPKLSARARVFATGQGRKTLPGATDAHAVALVGARMAGLRPVIDDDQDPQLAVLPILVDRRRSLGEDHTRTTPGWCPSFTSFTSWDWNSSLVA
jgi:hypothetical protein